MKTWRYIILITCTTFFAWAQKKSKTEYQFPVEMKPHVQEAFILEFNKGKILYGINCAKCHSSFEKKKEIIRQFTAEQFEAYKIRIANPDHEQSMTEEQLAPDELGLIITYLTYRKKD